jgi:hypothetical protein
MTLIEEKKEPQRECSIWTELCRYGEVRSPKLEYTLQQDDSIQVGKKM